MFRWYEYRFDVTRVAAERRLEAAVWDAMSDVSDVLELELEVDARKSTPYMLRWYAVGGDRDGDDNWFPSNRAVKRVLDAKLKPLESSLSSGTA